MQQQDKIQYTDKEMSGFMTRMANTHLAILALEAEKKRVAAEMAEEIREKKDHMDDLADKISKGYYWQDPIRVGE